MEGGLPLTQTTTWSNPNCLKALRGLYSIILRPLKDCFPLQIYKLCFYFVGWVKCFLAWYPACIDSVVNLFIPVERIIVRKYIYFVLRRSCTRNNFYSYKICFIMFYVQTVTFKYWINSVNDLLVQLLSNLCWKYSYYCRQLFEMFIVWILYLFSTL